MCILVAVSQVGEAPLVIAGNRDERLERPADAMVVLRDEPRTIGGRDHTAGGTWMAVNEHGVVAGLTNQPLPDGPDPAKRSRGELPLSLTGGRRATEVVEAFRFGDHNPAWLLVGDRTSLFLLDTAEESVTELPPGVHVLENRALGASSAKVERIRALLPQGLEVALADHAIPHEEDVPDEFRAYRATCVHTDEFGTRWSGIVTVPAVGRPVVRYADGPPCTTPFRAARWS